MPSPLPRPRTHLGFQPCRRITLGRYFPSFRPRLDNRAHHGRAWQARRLDSSNCRWVRPRGPCRSSSSSSSSRGSNCRCRWALPQSRRSSTPCERSPCQQGSRDLCAFSPPLRPTEKTLEMPSKGTEGLWQFTGNLSKLEDYKLWREIISDHCATSN